MKKIMFLGYLIVLTALIHCALVHAAVTPTPTPTPTPPTFTVEFGTEETVYDWSSQKCEDNDIPDFPTRALIDSSGNIQLYSSHFVNRKFIGNNLDNITHNCTVIFNSDNNPLPRQYDDAEWLSSPYSTDGTTIYALTHMEYHGWNYGNCKSGANYNPNCWWNAINLAKSVNAGQSFTHATPPNQNVANTSINYNPNNELGVIGVLTPSNILQNDGYYYAMVSVRIQPNQLITVTGGPSGASGIGTCVMRTNNLADPKSWRLWNGNDWNVSPLGVPQSGLCARVFSSGSSEWHQSTYLNTIVSVSRQYREISGHIDNGFIQTMNNFTTGNTPLYWFSDRNQQKIAMYYTFLQPGAETRNFEDIGRSPWMYYVTCGDNVASCPTGFGGMNRNLKRVRVRFNKTGEATTYDVLDLHFNEYIGTKTLDSSFYGNNGTLADNAAFQQDGSTKYIHLDGNSHIRVNYDPNLNLDKQITITARIRTTQRPAPDTFPVIVRKQEGAKRNYGLYLLSTGQMHFSVGNGGTQYFSSSSNTSINDGNWHDVQVNFSDGTTQFVIDGKLDRIIYQGGKLASGVNNGPLTIGNNFSGDLDSLTIYNYLLPVPTSATPTPTHTPTPTPTPIPGDLTNVEDSPGDQVNINDYNILIADFGKTGSTIVGDIDKNGKVDIFDYNILVGNFGK